MEIRYDDSYESLGAEYQYQLVGLLDKALKKVSLPTAQRREVCEQFLFDMAMLHDQGVIQADDVTVSPALCFASGEILHTPNKEFELHDYAFGNVSEYFDSTETS
ncbi:MAG: hypothetical protein CMJ47_00760 [Planctomyces sp.]|nr:hypothetical protein [Planctomyces sp.]